MPHICNFENNDKGIKKGYIFLLDLSIFSKLISHINAMDMWNDSKYYTKYVNIKRTTPALKITLNESKDIGL